MVAKSARYLAPIALAAVAVATYLIVQSGLDSHPRPASPPAGMLSSGSEHRKLRRTPRFYVVKPGDTLSQISIKTHVSLFQISHLNPNLSPNSLQTGQRLRLRR